MSTFLLTRISRTLVLLGSMMSLLVSGCTSDTSGGFAPRNPLSSSAGVSASVVEAPEFVLGWGSPGSGNGQFADAFGLATDAAGNVYVSEFGAGSNFPRVQKFKGDSTFVTKWGSKGPLPGQFNQPQGIAVDKCGFVYVADKVNNRVQKFTDNGAFITLWPTASRPSGIAVTTCSQLYLGSENCHCVQQYTSNGTLVRQWGSHGSGPGQFQISNGVAIDSDGNVHVVDQVNNRIQKFDSTGTFIAEWGSLGTGDGEFDQPFDIAIDETDRVYVTDRLNHRIQMFTSDGTFLTTWGSFGSGPGQFGFPAGVDVDNDGNIFVVDGNSRVQKFAFASKVVSLDIRPRSCPNPLNRRSVGVLPAALLGTSDLDVRDIKVSSVSLEGALAPIASHIEDVSSPLVGGEQCDCTGDGPDGIDDLALEFSAEDIVQALGPVSRGDVLVLSISGNLVDGTPFEASDCVVIVGGSSGRSRAQRP